MEGLQSGRRVFPTRAWFQFCQSYSNVSKQKLWKRLIKMREVTSLVKIHEISYNWHQIFADRIETSNCKTFASKMGIFQIETLLSINFPHERATIRELDYHNYRINIQRRRF